MRTASAWFLLFISTSHWLGAHLCLEVSYYIGVQKQMDDAEKAIAEQLRQEEDIESTVDILEEEELSPRGKFYDAFAFSKEVNGEKVFFKINQSSQAVSLQKVSESRQASDRDDGRTALLKRLFQEFIVFDPDPPLKECSKVNIPGTSPDQSHNLIFVSIPSPPPDAA
jgi:hypothetical protein